VEKIPELQVEVGGNAKIASKRGIGICGSHREVSLSRKEVGGNFSGP
jgi:hypothetical protein